MKVRDIMTSQVITVQPSASVREVARIMRDRGVESVPVCERERLVGMVTEREIIDWVAGEADRQIKEVGSLMKTQFPTVAPEADIMDAAMVMVERGVRRLPVVEGSCLVGLVCLGDIAAASHIFGGVVLAKTGRGRARAGMSK